MKKICVLVLVIGLFLVKTAWIATATTIDFENNTSASYLIGDYYSSVGVVFGNSWYWYNSDPQYYTSHSGVSSAVSNPFSKINFTTPVSGVSAYFNVYGGDLTWQAFSSTDALLGSIQLETTYQPNPAGIQYYSLPFDNISKVVLSGPENSEYYYNMDDLSFNSSAPVPEPSTIFLLGAGLAGLGLVVRRRAKK